MRKTTMEATPFSGVRMRYTEDEKKVAPGHEKKLSEARESPEITKKNPEGGHSFKLGIRRLSP